METFEARLAGWLRLLTRVATGGLAVAGSAAALAGEGLAAAGAAALLAGLWAASVRGYAVGAGRLEVLRPGRRTRIPLDALTAAEPAPDLLRHAVSLAATRGIFGAVGVAWRRGPGVLRLYVTDPDRTVLLRFDGRRAVAVSPADPARFLAAVRREARAWKAPAQPSTQPRPPPRT